MGILQIKRGNGIPTANYTHAGEPYLDLSTNILWMSNGSTWTHLPMQYANNALTIGSASDSIHINTTNTLISGSLIVTGSIYGNIVSASYALTASYVSGISSTLTSSYAITSSYSNTSLRSDFSDAAGFATNSTNSWESEFALESVSASYALTASYVESYSPSSNHIEPLIHYHKCTETEYSRALLCPIGVNDSELTTSIDVYRHYLPYNGTISNLYCKAGVYDYISAETSSILVKVMVSGSETSLSCSVEETSSLEFGASNSGRINVNQNDFIHYNLIIGPNPLKFIYIRCEYEH